MTHRPMDVVTLLRDHRSELNGDDRDKLADEIEQLRAERDQYLERSTEYGNTAETLRAALKQCAAPFTRDPDDHSAVLGEFVRRMQIAYDALR